MKLPKILQKWLTKLIGDKTPEIDQVKSPVLNQEDEDFVRDSKAALLSKTTPMAHVILYTVLVAACIGLIWSYFASIDQITVGMGKIIPSSHVKIIQSLDGGIVEEIGVQEGQVVKIDQVLIKLDETRYKAEYTASYKHYLVLSAMVARLNAEALGQDTINFPVELKNYPEITLPEIKLFETRKKNLLKELEALQQSYDTASNQTKMYQALLHKGYSSKLEFYRSLQNTEEYKTKIIQKQNQFTEEVHKELTKNKGDLQSLIQELDSLRDKMVHTTIRSPVNGIVKQLNVVTVGGVITPGMNIMEIVPLSDTLLVETRVKPADIAFVHVGQPATVKITAYDFSIYGGLPGIVEYISADTIHETPATKDANTTASQSEEFYIVNVRTNRNYLGSEKHKLYIMPGMMASVHIKTGQKTVLQYLLKPLIKAKEEALRER